LIQEHLFLNKKNHEMTRESLFIIRYLFKRH